MTFGIDPAIIKHKKKGYVVSMFDTTLVKYKTTEDFGHVHVGSVINIYRLFKFSGKEALLYATSEVTGASSCIFIASYDRGNDYYVSIPKKGIIYVNTSDFTKEIKAILNLYNFPKHPSKKELDAIKLLEKAGYKVTK